MESIYPDSIIIIAPEGRMKRSTGLDLEGNKMTVRSGVVEVLADLKDGQIVFAYSGGLHHVQVPGEGWPRIFKTLYMDIEVTDVTSYQHSFNEPIGSHAWRKLVLNDLQHRLETKPPLIQI